MKTYRIPTFSRTTLKTKATPKGESLEEKIERIVNNKEPIKDGAPIIFTERKEGVKAAHNIRTDRFEIAVDAATKIQKSYKARREERAKKPVSAETEPIQGKGDEPPTGKP